MRFNQVDAKMAPVNIGAGIMEKVWYQDNFPVGMTIAGETLKELAEKDLFDVAYIMIDNDVIQPEEADFSSIEDGDTWVIALNTNSGTIQFIQLFIAQRVIIETTTKPEAKASPPYAFAYAL